LYFVPLLYMYAALPILRARDRLDDRASGGYRIPGGATMVMTLAISTFFVTLGAIVLSVIPPDDGTSKFLFELKVVGGSVLLVAIGLALYGSRSRR
jgi:MFS-type transporter involved in bile tolerance (Atg22 family)